VVLAFHQLGKA
jgi:hypothetical protein